MTRKITSEKLVNLNSHFETPVLAWLGARDWERARLWGAAFSIWESYDDFLAERDGLFVGYGAAGVTARPYPISFDAFEKWSRLTGAPAELDALDEFAAHCAFRADHPQARVLGRFGVSQRRDYGAVAVAGAQCVRVRPEIYARWRNGLAETGLLASPSLDAYATHVIACCASNDGRILRPLVRSS